MRFSKDPPVNRSRADDRGELLSVLPWAQQLGDGWNFRPGVLQIRRFRWLGRRLAALWTVLWFCALIAASGPHLVHHLTALPRPADHHSHTDEPRPVDHHTHTGEPRPPDCFVFFLMQHTPVAEDVLIPLPMPLPVGEPSVLERPLTVHAALWSLFLARAPPV